MFGGDSDFSQQVSGGEDPIMSHSMNLRAKVRECTERKSANS